VLSPNVKNDVIWVPIKDLACSNIWTVNKSDMSNVINLFLVVYKYGALCYELLESAFDVEKYTKFFLNAFLLEISGQNRPLGSWESFSHAPIFRKRVISGFTFLVAAADSWFGKLLFQEISFIWCKYGRREKPCVITEMHQLL